MIFKGFLMQSRAFCISCEGYSLQAEIMLAIQTMMEHCENSNHLLPQDFHDSHIPEQYTCGKTKCAYQIRTCTILHRRVVSAVYRPKCLYSVSFDESFNKALEKEQMDVILRFWNKEKKCVVSRIRYFLSEFLGHTRASDLLKKFLKGLGSLDQPNMVQVAMDGQSTNWRFYDKLVQQGNSVDIPMLLNMCSCDIRVIHRVFKRDSQMTRSGTLITFGAFLTMYFITHLQGPKIM